MTIADRTTHDLTHTEIAYILEFVANSRHPRIHLGTIAANRGLRHDDLVDLLHAHGYPEPGALLAAAATRRTLALNDRP